MTSDVCIFIRAPFFASLICILTLKNIYFYCAFFSFVFNFLMIPQVLWLAKFLMNKVTVMLQL